MFAKALQTGNLSEAVNGGGRPILAAYTPEMAPPSFACL